MPPTTVFLVSVSGLVFPTGLWASEGVASPYPSLYHSEHPCHLLCMNSQVGRAVWSWLVLKCFFLSLRTHHCLSLEGPSFSLCLLTAYSSPSFHQKAASPGPGPWENSVSPCIYLSVRFRALRLFVPSLFSLLDSQLHIDRQGMPALFTPFIPCICWLIEINTPLTP